MRRAFLVLLTAALFFPLGIAPTLAAQDATPAAGPSAFADLGLPELQITATQTEFQGLPDQLEAGRYLVTITVAEDVEFGAGIEFIQPSGVTPEEFVEFLAGPPAETAVEVADATPFPEEIATPAEGAGGPEAPPDFYYESLLAGGVAAMAGETGHAVIDLPPGEWVAWGGDPFQPQAPIVVEVTGEMPADLPEPTADLTISMDEYEINVTEGQLTAGSQIVRVENIGEQPHFLFISRGPDTMTQEQVDRLIEWFQTDPMGTPPPDVELDPETDFEDVGLSGTQSPEVTTWVEFDLEPGMYVLACFVPDQEDGDAHAFHGMYTVVEVGE